MSADTPDKNVPLNVEDVTLDEESVALDEPASDEAGTDEAVAVPASGVAAKAQARAAARAEAEADRGREFTVSARTLWRVLAALIGVAVIVAIGFGGWSWYDTKRELAAFDDSKSAASEFVTKYFTEVLGSGKNAEQVKDAVLPLTTGKMHDRVEKDSQGAVDFAKQVKIENFSSKVTSSSVSDLSKDHSVVVIAAQFSGTSATAPNGGKNLMLLQLTMDKVDGQWLVADLDVVPGVPTGDDTGPAPAVPTTPAPTAPATQPAG